MPAHFNPEEDTPAPGDQLRPEVLNQIAESITKGFHILKELLESGRVDEERIPGMVKENDCWDVHNNEAIKHDTELVKDWRESLNSLLLFAAIFAAVLTGFIIESKKMLEPDQTEILVDLVSLYLSNIGNLSSVALSRPKFEPTSKAVSVNCFLFASLGSSLMAALASVVALQWVADYDAAITRGGSSPMDRTKRRQFRHAGLVKWRMCEIIAALPLLLYSSVLLFWIGTMLWMLTINKAVARVIIGTAAISVFFYVSTTLLPTIYLSAPFRTPLSRGLYWLFRWSLSMMARLILCLPVDDIQLFFRGILSCIRPIDPVLTPSESTSKWIEAHVLPITSSRKRQDDAAERNPVIIQEALRWLSQQLPISTDARLRLIMFIEGMASLPQDSSTISRFEGGPLLIILEHLSGYYMTEIINSTLEEDEREAVGILLRYLQRPEVSIKLPQIEGYNLNAERREYWFQYCFSPGNVPGPGERESKMAFLLARDVPAPSAGVKSDLEASIMAIKWRNTSGMGWGLDIWTDIFNRIDRYSPPFLEACLKSLQKMTMLPSYRPEGDGPLWSSIISQALKFERPLTPGELLALVHAFESCVTGQAPNFSDSLDSDSIIRRPLLYGLKLSSKSKKCRRMHYKITTLIARAAASFCKKERQSRWAKWIVVMTWITRPKEKYYWETLAETIALDAETDVDGIRRSATISRLWGKVDMTWSGSTDHSKDIISITHAPLWPFDDPSINAFSQHAHEDPSALTWLQDFFKYRTRCLELGLKDTIFHLYRGALTSESQGYVVKYRNSPVCLGGVYWDGYGFYPILPLLSLSDD